MRLVVQKFGGSSVATAERIMRAARRAIQAKKAGHQVIVVVSARGDTTDELISLAREISERPPAREMDMLLSTGEQISIALMAMAIQSLGEKAISFTGAQIGIVTDSFHTKARIKNISTQRIHHALQEGNIVIVAGFQGIDEDYNITTLGRGGSDTTAVALAAVMKREMRDERREARHEGRETGVERPADKAFSPLASRLSPLAPISNVDCEIYTDVDGVYTTDPRIVPEARKLDFISYDEMLELASVGAGVMHSRSIEFARKFDVPLQVRSSFTDSEGTWIVSEADWMHDTAVCGCAIVKDEARINVVAGPDEPGVGHQIFAALAEQNIVVDMIVQNVGSGGKANVGFTVLKNELPATLAVLAPLASALGATIEHEEELSKVSIVGTGMSTHTGVAERMFAALAAAGVNMKMIATGDIKISVLVDKNDGTQALRAVHRAFQLEQPRPGAGLPSGSGPISFQRRELAAVEETRDPAGITQRLSGMEDIVVSDVLLDTEQGRVTLSDWPNQSAHCAHLFQAVAKAGIVVDMIVQNVAGPGRAELSFSVPRHDLERTLELARQVAATIDSAIRVGGDPNIARLFVLGVGMRTHTGVARRMCGALAERHINVGMLNTSEVCVTVVVDLRHGTEALAALKEAFRRT